jgi:hypothetical protein
MKAHARYLLRSPSMSKHGNPPNAASLNGARINSANAEKKTRRAMLFVLQREGRA